MFKKHNVSRLNQLWRAVILGCAIFAVLTGGVYPPTQAQEEKRIKFERGRNGATVSGNLAAKTTVTYNLYVKEGQKITVKVTSANGKVEVDTTNFSAGQFEDPGTRSLNNLPIEQTGDYQVYVRNQGGAATRYTLTVTVK